MIQIKNTSYIYHRESSLALDDISLSINDGEKIAIIGDNGSGKSTLAKMLIGLIKPRTGLITVDGIELNEKNLLAIRAKIGMVFQNPNFQFIGSNVEEDLAFGLQNQNMPRSEMQQRIVKIAEELGLQNILKTPPNLLSGGQKQKVAIASMLIMQPKYLVLDEVTSMLDSKNAQTLLETINKLYKQTKTTIISITHNMDEASLADRVIVMSKGKIIADGKPKNIFSQRLITEKLITPSFEAEVSSKLFGTKNIITSLDELMKQVVQKWK